MIDERIRYRLTASARLALLDLAAQVAAERRRQRGWRLVCFGTGRPPSTAPLVGGELVFGPPGAHARMEAP
jgi:hypothetical protein